MNDQHIKTDLAQQLETLTNFQQMFHLRFSVFLFFWGGGGGYRSGALVENVFIKSNIIIDRF